MQVIWDNTEAIGCALHFCNGTKDARQVLACVYKPEGNADVRRPYTTVKGSEVKATDEEDEEVDEEEEEEEEGAEGGASESTKGEGKGGTDGKGKENETKKTKRKKKKKKKKKEEEEMEEEESGAHKVAFKSYLLLLCILLFLVS
ncbi:unnamed protein product [Dibothriocephalus latus]|uniref:SCP domain-containing protein n=1 Tax=Dibothriocephalus latus TaxID=60516 RepID=A0A3P7LX76_DIBLA|nr:unnamed protein product [Dibothriocephalus latus]